MTQFEQITQSPEALGTFLAALPVIDGPWDTEFHARYCADCLYLGCDACPHEEFRNNPGWWLTLETGDDQAAAEDTQKIKIICPWSESGWISGTIAEFRFSAKVYGVPSSKYGINGGRVSKLEIKKGTMPVARDGRNEISQTGCKSLSVDSVQGAIRPLPLYSAGRRRRVHIRGDLIEWRL